MAKLYRDDECHRCRGPLDTTGTPQWCKACRNAYKRAYDATHPEYREKRAANVARLRSDPERAARYDAARKAGLARRTAERQAAWEASRRERGLLTYAEAAASLGMSEDTLRHQVYNGALTVACRERGRTLIAADEVERYRRENRGVYGWMKPTHPLYDVNVRMAAVRAGHERKRESA